RSPLPAPPLPAPLLPYTTLFRSPRSPVRLRHLRDLDANPVRPRVLGGVGQCLRDDVVDPDLDMVGQIEIRAVHTRGLPGSRSARSEEHTSELQSRFDLVCRLLLE